MLLVIYNLVSFLLVFLLIPFILAFSLHPRYKASLLRRFLFPQRCFKPIDILFHACSLGEVKSLNPLLEVFKSYKIGITTTTTSGHKAACKSGLAHAFLPFEFWLFFWFPKVKVLIVLEAELWLMLFVAAKARGAKTILLNARISDKSYSNYLRFKWFYKIIFSYIDTVYAQSDQDKLRLLNLGAHNVVVLGNIKTLTKITCNFSYKKPDSLIFTAASTHEGEEHLVLENFAKFRNQYSHSCKLFIVPRHSHRFNILAKQLKQVSFDFGLSFQQFSSKASFDSDIVLIDKMGILNEIYAISNIVVLGGSFAKIGGHNPLEPAQLDNVIITGEHIFNQYAMFQFLDHILFANKNNLLETMVKAIKQPKAKVKAIPNMTKIYTDIKALLE